MNLRKSFQHSAIALALVFTMSSANSNAQTPVGEKLFVTSYADGDVYEVTPAGLNPNPYISGVTHPEGLAVDSAGDIFVTAASAKAVYEFPPEGGSASAEKLYYGGALNDLNTPNGLTFNSSGYLYVANYGQSNIVAVAPGGGAGSGTTNQFLTNQVDGVAFDSAGDLFCCDKGDQIDEWSNIDGTLATNISFVYAAAIYGTNLFIHQPYGLAFDSAGDLFVANGDVTNTIIEYPISDGVLSTNPVTFATAASGLSRPFGITFDSAGNLFVGNYGTGTIIEFTNDDQTLTTNENIIATILASGPQYLVIQPDVPAVPVALQGTNVVLQYANSGPGTNYILYSSPTLTPPITWTPLVSEAGYGGTLTFVVPQIRGTTSTFYTYQLQPN